MRFRRYEPVSQDIVKSVLNVETHWIISKRHGIILRLLADCRLGVEKPALITPYSVEVMVENL